MQLHSEVYNNPSPIGHGWMHVDRRCHSIRNRLTALSNNLKLLVVDIECFSFSSNDESDETKCFSLNDMFLEK